LAKVGIVERIRLALGGSPGDHGNGHVEHASAHAPNASNYEPQLELLRDTARDLCADAWVANRLTLDMRMDGGKPKLGALPETIPYLKAAYAIRQDELSPEVKDLFQGLAG
jgi:hypothetical protein